MLIIRFGATKDIVLTHRETGEQIRLTKFIRAHGNNLQGQLGIDAPPDWRISSVKREPGP